MLFPFHCAASLGAGKAHLTQGGALGVPWAQETMLQVQVSSHSHFLTLALKRALRWRCGRAQLWADLLKDASQEPLPTALPLGEENMSIYSGPHFSRITPSV